MTDSAARRRIVASVVYAGERIVQGLIRGLVRARLVLPNRTGRVP